MNNTKTRHEQIYASAEFAVRAVGGVAWIDRMAQGDRIATLRRLYKVVAEETGCHPDTAKRNVAKALRRARHKEMESGWGGAREGAGYPKGQPRNQ